MHLRRKALPKFHKHSPQKTSTLPTCESSRHRAARNSPALSPTTARLRPLGAISPLAPKSPLPLNQHHGLWPTANPQKPLLASNHHSHKKPRRPVSPPTNTLALPKPLGQAAQLPQHNRLSRGKGRVRLTAPQPQTSPRSIFKVPCPSNCHAAHLTRDSSAGRFRCPKII